VSSIIMCVRLVYTFALQGQGFGSLGVVKCVPIFAFSCASLLNVGSGLIISVKSNSFRP
jgi:hypothetical protein